MKIFEQSKIIHRNDCVVCDKKTEPCWSFASFPVFMSCIKDSLNNDEYSDLNFGICKFCGTIQATDLIPLDVVYQDTHIGSIGKTWENHHQNFAEFVKPYCGKNIFEIGGGTGDLANIMLEQKKETTWTEIEPNDMNLQFLKKKGVNVIKGWFDENYVPDKEYDTFIISHVVEHFYQPKSMMKHINSLLPVNGKLLISVPNLKYYLENKNPSSLSFEHTYYFTVDSLSYLMSQCGFKEVEHKYYGNHSIFFCYEKSLNINYEMPKNYNQNKQLFTEFAQSFEKIGKKWTNYLNNNRSKNDNNYLFGGHVSSLFLMRSGLDMSWFKCILDNDPYKHNKRLYGTDLIVQSPEILKNKENCLIALNAGVYTEEIKNDIAKINSNIIYI